MTVGGRFTNSSDNATNVISEDTEVLLDVTLVGCSDVGLFTLVGIERMDLYQLCLDQSKEFEYLYVVSFAVYEMFVSFNVIYFDVVEDRSDVLSGNDVKTDSRYDSVRPYYIFGKSLQHDR